VLGKNTFKDDGMGNQVVDVPLLESRSRRSSSTSSHRSTITTSGCSRSWPMFTADRLQTTGMGS